MDTIRQNIANGLKRARKAAPREAGRPKAQHGAMEA